MGLNWINNIVNPDARTGKRKVLSGVIAHYWDGGTPQARNVLNISLSGLYLLTEERWYADTVLKLMLQFSPESGAGRSQPGAVALCVLARVVRLGSDGIALAFLFNEMNKDPRSKMYPECATDRQAMREFLACVEHQRQNAGL
jgi:hypothetical protein